MRLKDKIAKLKEEVARLNAINAEMMKSEDKQISLTDPDARSMATSGKDTEIVGYNVQTAVDTKNHLIVAHEVTNVGTDRRQLSNIAEQARTEMGVETLDAVADRGYYAGEEIRACRGGRHHRHATKAYDLERKGGGALRQAGLPLRGSGGCLRLSCWTKACIFLHDRGQRLAPTSLPDQRLSELRYQA